MRVKAGTLVAQSNHARAGPHPASSSLYTCGTVQAAAGRRPAQQQRASVLAGCIERKASADDPRHDQSGAATYTAVLPTDTGCSHARQHPCNAMNRRASTRFGEGDSLVTVSTEHYRRPCASGTKVLGSCSCSTLVPPPLSSIVRDFVDCYLTPLVHPLTLFRRGSADHSENARAQGPQGHCGLGSTRIQQNQRTSSGVCLLVGSASLSERRGSAETALLLPPPPCRSWSGQRRSAMVPQT
jgi:hypothetical protein